MGATDYILGWRYGYGPSRGPRRMPARMGTRFVDGLDPETFGFDMPDREFDEALFRLVDAKNKAEDELRNVGAVAQEIASLSFQTGRAAALGVPGRADVSVGPALGAPGRADSGASRGLVFPASAGGGMSSGGSFQGDDGFGWDEDLEDDPYDADDLDDEDDEDDDEELFGSVPGYDRRFEETYGQFPDFLPTPSFSLGPTSSFAPAPPSSFSPAPPPFGPTAAVVGPGSGPAVPSWHDYRQSQRDVWKATKKVAKAEGRLQAAQAGAPTLPSFGAVPDGCTPSAYYGAYSRTDPVTQQISSIESEVMGIVRRLASMLYWPKLVELNRARDRVIDTGSSSNGPQAMSLEAQAMGYLRGLDPGTAGRLWVLARQRDNLRRQLQGRPTEPIPSPPALV